MKGENINPVIFENRETNIIFQKLRNSIEAAGISIIRY